MEGAKEIFVDLNNSTNIKIQKYKLIECPNSTSDSNKLFDTNGTIFLPQSTKLKETSNLIIT